MQSKHPCSSVQELLLASWAPKTRTNYEVYKRKWVQYCQNNIITNPSYATYEQAMHFLAIYFTKKIATMV